MGFKYLFIFPPCYVVLCASKACHRLSSECFLVFGNFSLFKTPFLGQSSIPTCFVFFFVFYIFSYLLLKTTGLFSGCLMYSASFQMLFCGIYSVFKYSFVEFVGEKVVSPSYSSAILGMPPLNLVFNRECCPGTVFTGRSVVALMKHRQGWKRDETGYVKNIVCGYFIFSYSLNLLYTIRFILKHFFYFTFIQFYTQV